jgi:hypothetical protein
MPGRKELLQDFYAKYAPDQELSDERFAAIEEKYGDNDEQLLKDFYAKYAPDQEVSTERLDAIYTKYGLKKKEPTTPTLQFGYETVSQALASKQPQAKTPLVAQSKLRGVQQPVSEAALKRSIAKSTERAGKSENIPVSILRIDEFNKQNGTNLTPSQIAGNEPVPEPVNAAEAMGRAFLGGVNSLTAATLSLPSYLTKIVMNPLMDLQGMTEEQKKIVFDVNDNNPANPSYMWNKAAEYYKRDAQQLQEPIKQDLESSITKQVDEGDYLGAARTFGVQMAGSIPSTIAIATAASAGVPLPAVTAGGSVVFGSQNYNDIPENSQMTEAEKQTNSYLKGLAEGLFEQLGTGALTKNAMALIKKEGKEGAKEILKNQYTTAAKEALKQYFPVVAPIQEGLTEAATTLAQNVVDKYTDPEKTDIDILQGTSDSFLVGSAMGTAFGAAPSIVNSVRKLENKPKAQEIESQLAQIDNDLNNDAIPDETKQVLTEQRAQLIENANNLIEADKSEYDALPDNAKDALDDVVEKISEIDNGIATEGISDASKKALETKKTELESTYNGIIEEAKKEIESATNLPNEQAPLGTDTDSAETTKTEPVSELGETARNEENLAKQPSELKQRLIDAGAPQNLIESISDSVGYEETELFKERSLIDKIFKPFAKNESIKASGLYYSDYHYDNTKAVVNSLIKDKKLKDKVTVHEAVHAATYNLFSDVLMNKGKYTKEQKDAVDYLMRVAAQYKNSIPESKRSGKVYGAKNSLEFLAEFVSNPVFRDYIAKNTPTEKRTKMGLFWESILEAYGVKKSNINEAMVADIQKAMDYLFEAGKERIRFVDEVKSIATNMEVPKSVLGKSIREAILSTDPNDFDEAILTIRSQYADNPSGSKRAIGEDLVNAVISGMEEDVIEGEDAQESISQSNKQTPVNAENVAEKEGEPGSQSNKKQQVEILDTQRKIAQLEKELRKAPLKPRKGVASQKQIRTQIRNYQDQLRDLEGKPPRIKPEGSVLTRTISRFQSEVDEGKLSTEERLVLDLIGRVSESDKDIQGLDKKQVANQKKKGVVVKDGASLNQIVTDFISENNLDAGIEQDLRDYAIDFISKKDAYEFMKSIKERESTPDPDAMREDDYYNYGYEQAEELEMTDEEITELEIEIGEIKDLTQEQYEQLKQQFAESESNTGTGEGINQAESGTDSVKAKEELEENVRQAEKVYQSAQNKLTKAKQAADKAGREEQMNIFNKKPSDSLLFGTDLRSLNNRVKAIQTEVDSAKENLDKAKLELENFMPSNQVQLEIDGSKKTANPSGSLASTSPGGTLTDLKRQAKQASRPYEKSYDAVKAALKEMGVPIAEGYLSKKVRGIYKLLPKKVRVHSLWQIGTVTHEVAHWISDKFDIGKKIRSKDAIEPSNPNAAKNREIRKELTKIYLEFYPNAKKEHSLTLRVEEGIAVLLQNYLYDPQQIEKDYPVLVKEFINPVGLYYHPMFTQTLEKMNKIIDDYSSLSEGDKIGERVADRSKKTMQEDNKGFTWSQWTENQFASQAEPLARIDKEYGSGLTDESSEIAYRRWQTRGHIIATWVKGEQHAMTLDKSGNWKPLKYNMKDLAKEIKDREKEFDYYLISRRAIGDVNYLHDLENELSGIMQDYDADTATKEEVEKVQELNQKIAKQQAIIEGDNFDIQEANAFIDKYEAQFKKAEEIYDYINNEALKFANTAGRLSNDRLEAFEKNKSYAAFNRITYDEMTESNTLPTTGSQKSSITAFKTRTGSMKQIVSPVYSQMFYISEVINKGMQNMIWKKVADMANTDEVVARDYFEPIPTKVVVDKETNAISYPQLNDNNLVPVWTNGTPKFYLASPPLVAMVESMKPQEVHAAIYLAKKFAGLFARMTTSANPLFPLINLPVDTISAWMNSKTGFKPVLSQASSLIDMADYAFGEMISKIEPLSKWYESVRGKKIGTLPKDDLKLFEKYLALGGSTQTLSGYYDMTPDEMVQAIREDSKVKRILSSLDKYTIGLLEIPSNTSEYLTRFAEFKRAKENGYSDDVAMYMASEVSVPFIQQGKLGGKTGQEFVRTIPYFNASMQVMAKFLKTAKNNPKQTALVAGSIMALQIVAALATMGGADDDDLELLSKMEPEDLSKFIFIPNSLFGGKGLTKIRVPEQIGWPGALTIMSMLQHRKQVRYSSNEYTRAVTTQVPRQFNFLEPEQAMFAWMPQVVRPSVEVVTNKRSYPEIRPIVPLYLEKRRPEFQTNKYTSETAIALGNITGYSPIKIDYFIKSQFGKIPVAAIDLVETQVTGKESKASSPITQVDIANYEFRGRQFNAFYKNATYWKKVKDSNRQMMESGNYSDEDRFNLINSANQYEIVEDLISQLSDKVREGKDVPKELRKTLIKTVEELNAAKEPYSVSGNVENLRVEAINWLNNN